VTWARLADCHLALHVVVLFTGWPTQVGIARSKTKQNNNKKKWAGKVMSLKRSIQQLWAPSDQGFFCFF
jgi:hypothetical protein